MNNILIHSIINIFWERRLLVYSTNLCKNMRISELKRDAISELSGKWGKAIGINFIVMLLTFGLTLIPSFAGEGIVAFLVNLLISLITFSFSYGVLASMIKLSRTEKVDLMDFVTIGLKNLVKVIKIYLLMLLKLWFPILLYIVAVGILVYSMYASISNLISATLILGLLALSAILIIVSCILYVIKALLYSLVFYLLYDNPNATTKELLNKSAELMKGNRLKILLTELSFIGWIFLTLVAFVLVAIAVPLACPLVIIIASLVLSPYISFTLINFYERLAGISDVKVENNLNVDNKEQPIVEESKEEIVTEEKSENE